MNSLIRFEEVTTSNLSKLENFYNEVYVDCFPNPDERETLGNLVKYLQRGEGATDYCYHILIGVDENGAVVCGCIFDYFKSTNAGIIEFLAVRSNSQSCGIGSMLYKKVCVVLAEDAYKNGKCWVSNIFCEIDSPEYSQASVKKYLYFWHKLGFKHLDFSYIQPALSPVQKSVDGLWLVMLGRSVSGGYVIRVLHDYMKYAMGIEEPSNCMEYQKMKLELADLEKVGMLSII